MATRIKICGLYRPEDIDIINELRPNYAGFIIDFPKSHRSVSYEEAKVLTSRIDEGITRVGVFVNPEISAVTKMLDAEIIDVAQFHGQESDEMIRAVKESTGKPVIKAYLIQGAEDVASAMRSPADYILLDGGLGAGATFDWSLISGVDRPYFLAGGLNSTNLAAAIGQLHPYAVDLSSGVETDKIKDRTKIAEVIRIVRDN